MPDWVRACRVEDVPTDGGACVVYEGAQIAVFQIGNGERWFAVQNRCPHWNENVLSRAMTGEQDGRLKIACPMHKRTYALEGGQCLSVDDGPGLASFAVRVEDGVVWIERPSADFVAAERRLAGRSPAAA